MTELVSIPTPLDLGITPYRVVGPIIALFFIVYAWNHVLRGTKTIWEALLWTVFWGGIASVVLFPAWLSILTTWTGIKGQANAVFAIAIGVLLFIVFHMLVRLERMQKRMTEIVRHGAIKDSDIGESTKFQAPKESQISNSKAL